MQMKCDKLMQDALNLHIDPEARAALNAMRKPAISGYTTKEGVGIDINSKLETALAKINSQNPMGKSGFTSPYMDKESLYKKLIKEGVSRKEIAFGLEGMLEKTSISGRDKKLLKILSAEERRKLGIGNKDSDKVFLDKVQDKAESTRPKIEKISNDYNAYTYNLQGQNNPTYEVRGLKLPNSKKIGSPGHFPEEGLIGWSRSYVGTQPGIDGKVLRLDEFQSDWAQDPKIQQALGDFPIDHNDFKKLMIVDGLDRTLNEGLDTMVIPITRTLNNLVGTKEVSQAYRDLNIGILPKIRKELEKSELLLDIKHVKRDTDNINYHDFEVSLYNNKEVRDNIRDDFRNRIDIIADGDRVNKDIIKIALLELTSSGKATTAELKSLKKQVEDIKAEVEEAFVLKLKDKASREFGAKLPKGYTAEGMPTPKKFIELKKVLEDRTKLGYQLDDTTKLYLGDLDMLERDTQNKYFPDFAEKGEGSVGQIKKMLADPYVQSREDEGTLQAISRALTDQSYVQSKQGAIPYDTIIDNLRISPYDNVADIEEMYSYYKELIPDLPEFYKSPGKFKKYRWDALSVAGTLGLGEAYSKLQEQAN